jgi:hypothetical protein
MYPVCVMEQRYTWEQPTVLSYANAAFADLTLYSMVRYETAQPAMC